MMIESEKGVIPLDELERMSPEHRPEENENYKMAHRYMEMYVDSLVDEYKVKKENAYLVQKLDRITDELIGIKKELGEVKAQNAAITEGFRVLDFTRLTIAYGQLGKADTSLEDIQSLLGGSLTPDAALEAPVEAAAVPTNTRVASPPAASSDGPPGQSLPQDEELSPEERFKKELSPIKRNGPEPETPEAFHASPPAQEGKRVAKGGKKKKSKPKAVTVIANILFYLSLLMLIVGAFSFAQSDDPEKSLFGYRYYYIKTASMEPVLPVGSVVITKSVPTEEIQVGDDITVYVGNGSTDDYLTHRVVGLTTDQSGELAFQTKGVNNKANDPTPFNEKLVVGRVVFCIPKLGVVMTFVRSQLLMVVIIFVLFMALSFMLKLLFSSSNEESEESGGKKGKGGKKQKGKHAPETGDT